MARSRRASPPAAAQPARSGAAEAESTTRERILDVALDLFVRKGYAETSLREIAAELEFSKAALYYHFESKQDILLALHMRVHHLTDEVLPLLQAEAGPADMWARLVDGLIGLALAHRRLMEFHIRNQEAIQELHRGAAMEKHGPVGHDLDQELLGLLTDRSAPVELRVRRVASLATVAGVLLAAGAFSDVPDAALESALRNVVQHLLAGGPG